MGNLLKKGMNWLAKQLEEHCSVTIHYRRGGAILRSDLAATIGKTELTAPGDEVTVFATIRDYLIRRESLQATDGTPIIPMEKDEILELDGGKIYVYQLLPIDGKRAGGESDNHRVMWRLHTKFLREE